MTTPLRILVTGASGFVGWHCLAPLAARGFEVHALTRAATIPGAAACHAVDLMDPSGMRELLQRLRPSHLLHLAWTVTPGAFWSTRENLDWVAASLELYRSFVAVGGRRFIGAGTCAEYDWSPACVADPLDETVSPCRPATLYGVAKDSLRRMLDSAAALDDVSFAWGRLFFLFGPREKPGRLVSDAIARLTRGEPYKTTAGTQRRDFLHVADAGGAFAALAASSAEGAVNIASGDDHPLAELLALVAARLGGGELLRLGAVPMPPSEPARIAASVRRLREEVGFIPSLGLVEGIEDTIVRALGSVSTK